MKITIGKSLKVGEEPGVWKWLIGSPGATLNKRPGHIDQSHDELSHKGDWLKWKSAPLRQKHIRLIRMHHRAEKDGMLNLEENDTWAWTRDLHSGSAWIPTSKLAGKSETKPVRYISLHYRAATGCQVADARPRVQCVILELRLPANYKPRQHAPIKDATLSVCWVNLSNYIFVTYEKT